MRHFAAIVALLGLIAASPSLHAQDSTSGLSESQKKDVEALIGTYLRAHPEVILDSIRAMQEREQAAQVQRQRDGLASRRTDIENDPASPVVGNPRGDITIAEFFDYRCGYCKSVLPAIQRLLKEDTRVRYVMKEFPILTPESRIAAKLALAVWNTEPKRYLALHTKLMEARGDLTEKRIFDIAKSAGIDVERAILEMESPAIERALAANAELAQALGVTGTPGFVIGSRLVPGAVDYVTLKKMVAEARGS